MMHDVVDICESVVLFKVWGSSRDAAHSGWTWTRDIASTRLLFTPQARNDATCNFNVLYLGINAIKVARR
jgi:hypothetical protein